MPEKQKQNFSVKVVDLFCGVGGLTHGFIKESLNVVAGYDIDADCKYAYEANNKNFDGRISEFIDKSIIDVTADEISAKFADADVKILIGCAPCQPFSTYSYKNQDEKKINLLLEFARLIEEVKPDIVSMENVPRLAEFDGESVFGQFIEILKTNGYEVTYEIVYCPEYGIPQHRKRLVLLASRFGKIELIKKTHTEKTFKTVKDAIGKMPPLESGEVSPRDSLHRATKLSELNLKRIKQSVQGGTWKDWDEDLRLKCHLKTSGETYVSVYGRMSWNKPAPTMTTHCMGIGNGRFGHPEQDRAISLREAALIQTFPRKYKFVEEGKPFTVKRISTQIGNAVPVKLGSVIAKSIKLHLEKFNVCETLSHVTQS
jgi:DNA (cytosine-5)-methyltransferase 1